ncbi:molybdenum cofactor synthesis protein cinnamon [Lasioglossum baleicum]|uniref:molybdenum cofactor synthesis protein cinnamon n=1 Tax=Lasioglossum baleicum TaxID=434251 RepID=UPI003FCD4F17
METLKFGVLTISDSCYTQNNEDRSSPEIVKILGGKVYCQKIIPDNEHMIKSNLIQWSDDKQVDVILTTGGTGFSERDVTPEATRQIIKKEAPGIALAMLTNSLKITPMAMLSRGICGIRGKTLIVNLPGSPKAVKECLDVILPAIPHAVDLLRDDGKKVKDTHNNIQNSSSVCAHKCQAETPLCLGNIVERHRESPYPMVSVEFAEKMIRKCITPLKSVSVVNVEEAYGRVLDSDLHSKYDLPPFRASIKDGYAVLANDGKGKRKVLSGIKAGDLATAIKLQPGTCVRVNTGASIPNDATAVVQVEDTKLIEGTSDNTEEKEIEIMTEVKSGQDIRPIGCDIKKGELILKAGTQLGAVELGLLSACGYKEVSVIDLPKVGVLSTGDELQSPGTVLMPGHVYDSNKITLLTILKENGFHPVDMGIAQDEEAVMVSKIKHALSQVDVLITTGSVSMGDRDMLKPILKHHFGATIHFARVNMKPGKPTTFATCIFEGRERYLFCLPGNPVSATVTMRLFALPALKFLCKDDSVPTILEVKLTSSYTLDPRPEYARAILKWNEPRGLPCAYSTGNQISSKLLNCKQANALLMLPARTTEKPELHQGDVVQAMLLGMPQYT